MRSLLLVLLVPALAAAQDRGPLEVRNMRTVALPFLRLGLRDVGLPEGRSEFGATLAVANDVRFTSFVREDAETVRLGLGYRRGVGRGWTVGAELPLLSRGGGALDPLIDAYHRIIGQTQFRANGVPYGRSELVVGGRSFGSATGLGDLSLRAARDLGGFSLGTGVKLPTGRAGGALGSGAVDLGLDLQKGWHSGAFDLLLGGSVVFQGSATELPDSRPVVGGVSAALVWAPNGLDRVVLQWVAEGSPLEGERDHRLLALGYRRRLDERRSFELSFSEDDDVRALARTGVLGLGPDIAFAARYVVRF